MDIIKLLESNKPGNGYLQVLLDMLIKNEGDFKLNMKDGDINVPKEFIIHTSQVIKDFVDNMKGNNPDEFPLNDFSKDSLLLVLGCLICDKSIQASIKDRKIIFEGYDLADYLEINVDFISIIANIFIMHPFECAIMIVDRGILFKKLEDMMEAHFVKIIKMNMRTGLYVKKIKGGSNTYDKQPSVTRCSTEDKLEDKISLIYKNPKLKELMARVALRSMFDRYDI